MESRRLTPFFKLAFFTLLGLTILLFGGGVLFSISVPKPTTSQVSAQNQLFHAGYFALTALVGLFVGKVA